MAFWQWVVLGWIVLGIFTVVTVEIASRASGTKGLLSQDRILASFGYSVALIAGAPFLLLFSTAVSAKVLWQGQIPVIGRAWWPARAAKFTPPASRETILCQMIELRRKIDPRLRHRGSPSNWPMFQLWETTEAVILEIVEQYLWLRDGGLVEQIALEKIEIFHRATIDVDLEPGISMRSYIFRRVTEIDPLYLSQGTKLLDRAISVAERRAYDEIKQKKLQPSFPPKEWLKQRISAPMVERQRAPLVLGGLRITIDQRSFDLDAAIPQKRDWDRIKLRMLPDDELWTFNSPPETWQALAGRMGVALIRDGRAIDHAITVMN
jgi:hypothetical protein